MKSLLESRGLSPKRSLGQNFLIDHNLLRKLIDAAEITAGDVVLEVGPGTGTLTEALLERGCRVVACELDDSLAALLAERAAAGEVPGAERLTIVHADCLDSKEELSVPLRAALGSVLGAPSDPGAPPPPRPATFKLVANLPYGAATPLILTLLLKYPACTTLAVTIQNEVAERLLAPPGSSERGVLSVIAQTMCEPVRIATLPRECFWPRPDVTSAMLLMPRRPQPLLSDVAGFAEFSKRIFAQRRKQLGGVLGRNFPWPAGMSPQTRAQECSLPQLHELFHICTSRAHPDERPLDGDRKKVAE